MVLQDDQSARGAAELPPQPDDLPPIDFSTFVVSLCTSAEMHLDGDGEPEDNALALARQEIDLLAILQEKTRGNLAQDERLLLSRVLSDLRARYLEAVTQRTRRG